MQFPHGDDYRKHWEAEHLQYAIEQNELRRAKKENNTSGQKGCRATY